MCKTGISGAWSACMVPILHWDGISSVVVDNGRRNDSQWLELLAWSRIWCCFLLNRSALWIHKICRGNLCYNKDIYSLIRNVFFLFFFKVSPVAFIFLYLLGIWSVLLIQSNSIQARRLQRIWPSWNDLYPGSKQLDHRSIVACNST